jgi:nucleotide-binding universal stress UspA family protein
MNNVLIAVDDTKSAQAAVLECTGNLCGSLKPESVTLIYVEKFAGRSLMDEMLGEAEMSTLREVLEGTEFKANQDKKANAILDSYTNRIKESGMSNVNRIIRTGHPAEEVLKAAKEIGADMIIVGSRGKRKGTLLMGSVSREVANYAEVPVLVVK